MGDFTGFSFGDYYCGEGEPPTNEHKKIGVIRVSSGDRYNENLHPEIKDRTAEVPGLNGEYYFGSDFGSRSFDIEIAFDSLNEEQFRKLRQVFGTKDIKKLIFDERPYKYYLAKLESPIELSYVCFDEPKKIIGAVRDGVRVANRVPIIEEVEGEEQIIGYIIEREQVTPYEYQEGTQRVYKGEGKITFKAYFPFAKSVYKVLPSNEEESDWAVSSGILNSTQYASVDNYNSGSITVYNPGDIATGFRLYLPTAALNSATSLIYKEDGVHTTATLQLKTMTLKTGDVGVLVDTNNGLITGVSSAPSLDPVSGEYIYTTSGNLYNEYISSGYFFHLEPNVFHNYSTLQITGGANGIRIFYDYLYF